MFELIPHEIVDKHLAFEKLIPAMRSAFMEFSSKESEQPRRVVLWMERNRRQYVMPSYSKREGVLSTKLLTVFPDCAEKNLPVRNSYLLLFNENDGTLKCMMESEHISWKRTAAASVVATQAILGEAPKVLGVLGTGNQACAHIASFCKAFKIEEVKVWGRSSENIAKLSSRVNEIKITKCLSAEEAVHDADVVVTATSSSEPVLKGKWLKNGCHVNVIGAMKPSWREVDDDCMKDAVVYTDSREAAEQESGDIIQSKASIHAEVGEILLGLKAPKRDKITIFKSTGIAIQDAYAAKLVWDSFSSARDEREH